MLNALQNINAIIQMLSLNIFSLNLLLHCCKIITRWRSILNIFLRTWFYPNKADQIIYTNINFYFTKLHSFCIQWRWSPDSKKLKNTCTCTFRIKTNQKVVCAIWCKGLNNNYMLYGINSQKYYKLTRLAGHAVT